MIVDSVANSKGTEKQNDRTMKCYTRNTSATPCQKDMDGANTSATPCQKDMDGAKGKKFRYRDSNPGILRERQVCLQ